VFYRECAARVPKKGSVFVAKKQCSKLRGPGSTGTYPWRDVT
jgi:hypothetical protein